MGRAFESVWTSVETPAGTVCVHSRHSPGTGARPVVFVPGLGASGRSLLPTARALPAAFPVFVVDLPGFGKSKRPHTRLDLEGHASALASWASALGIERAIWVGHSFGSQVASLFAVRRPDLVERLALVSPTVDPRARTVRAQLGRLLRDGFGEPPRLLWILAGDYLGAGLGAVLHVGRVAVRDRPEERFPAIEAPALVVRGDRDPLVPEAWAEQIAQLLPAGRLLVIRGAVHAVPYVAPAELARAVEELCNAERGVRPRLCNSRREKCPSREPR